MYFCPWIQSMCLHSEFSLCFWLTFQLVYKCKQISSRTKKMVMKNWKFWLVYERFLPLLSLKSFLKKFWVAFARFKFLWVCGFSNEWGRQPDPFVEKLWLPFCYMLVAISKGKETFQLFLSKTFDLSRQPRFHYTRRRMIHRNAITLQPLAFCLSNAHCSENSDFSLI